MWRLHRLGGLPRQFLSDLLRRHPRGELRHVLGVSVEPISRGLSTGNLPVWREFDWQAQIPPGASIVMSAQSGSSVAGLNPAVPVNFAKATADTDTGPSLQNYDVGFIDTGHNGTGAFNTADPGVISRDLLRVTITLNPTLDHLTPPTLLHWKVQYDCMPAE
jgi:hypothetical protein